MNTIKLANRLINQSTDMIATAELMREHKDIDRQMLSAALSLYEAAKQLAKAADCLLTGDSIDQNGVIQDD